MVSPGHTSFHGCVKLRIAKNRNSWVTFQPKELDTQSHLIYFLVQRYVCMHACTYICMHVCMIVCTCLGITAKPLHQKGLNLACYQFSIINRVCNGCVLVLATPTGSYFSYQRLIKGPGQNLSGFYNVSCWYWPGKVRYMLLVYYIIYLFRQLRYVVFKKLSAWHILPHSQCNLNSSPPENMQ